MATETIPSINRIYRITEFDLLRTEAKKGNMYMCTDSHVLYYDETDDLASRVIYNCTQVQTINDLQHEVTPQYGTSYYCWEDNSLWIWLNKWIVIWSDYTYPSAYIYDNWQDNKGDIRGIYRYDNPGIPADDNGLLKDGSVVVRDRNRIIKGKISVDDNNDNLLISSFLGGGIRLLPNGAYNTEGEVLINDNGKTFIRQDFSVKDHEMYVDYTDAPESDPSFFRNREDPVYQVLHTGISRKILMYETIIGNGSTRYEIDHGMNTTDVWVDCRMTATNTSVNNLFNTIVDENHIEVWGENPITTDSIKVRIIGFAE